MFVLETIEICMADNQRETVMTMQQARVFLQKKKPLLRMEIEEYLSFAEVEKMDEASLLKDFERYMSR